MAMISEYMHTANVQWNSEQTVRKQLGSKELALAAQYCVVVKWGTIQKTTISLYVWHETRLLRFRTDKQLAIVQETGNNIFN